MDKNYCTLEPGFIYKIMESPSCSKFKLVEELSHEYRLREENRNRLVKETERRISLEKKCKKLRKRIKELTKD